MSLGKTKEKSKKSPRVPLKKQAIIHKESQCTVCKHPDRKEIDELFLAGFSVVHILGVIDDPPNLAAVYQHVRMTGLHEHRSHSLLSDARLIMDRAHLESREPSDALVAKAMDTIGKVTGETAETLKITGKIDIARKLTQLDEKILTNLMERVGLSLQECPKCRQPMSGETCVYCREEEDGKD